VLLADPDLELVGLQVAEGAGGLNVGDSVVNVRVEDTVAPYDEVNVSVSLRDRLREPDREGKPEIVAVAVAV